MHHHSSVVTEDRAKLSTTRPSCRANPHEAISGTSHPMLETLGTCWVGSRVWCPVQASALKQLKATWLTFPSRAGPQLWFLQRPSPVEALGSQIVVLLAFAACTDNEPCEAQVVLLKIGNACPGVRHARHCTSSGTSLASYVHEELHVVTCMERHRTSLHCPAMMDKHGFARFLDRSLEDFRRQYVIS